MECNHQALAIKSSTLLLTFSFRMPSEGFGVASNDRFHACFTYVYMHTHTHTHTHTHNGFRLVS